MKSYTLKPDERATLDVLVMEFQQLSEQAGKYKSAAERKAAQFEGVTQFLAALNGLGKQVNYVQVLGVLQETPKEY